MVERTAEEQALRDFVADELHSHYRVLAAQWLERLRDVLTVRQHDIFPTRQLLDHIPNLIDEIGQHLRAPASSSFSANTLVFAKATELGDLRFEQRATVHQLLREYDLLADVIGEFVVQCVERRTGATDPAAALRLMATIRAAIAVLQQQTVDRFVARYADLVRLQTEQLRDFNLLISHEIRQPLNVLRISAQLLEQPGAHVAQFASTVSRHVGQLAQVVSKLERLAGLAGPDSTSLTDQTVELGRLVGELADQLGPMARDRGVRLEVESPLPVLVTDPARVELVFTNLLVNAIKYSDPAKPDRRVTVRRSNGADDRIVVAVEDNGVGLPEDSVGRIFDRFFRGAGRASGEGFGLGLAIVRECMTAMEGTVQADSRAGRGTTFLLSWPASKAGRREPARDEGERPPDQSGSDSRP